MEILFGYPAKIRFFTVSDKLYIFKTISLNLVICSLYIISSSFTVFCENKALFFNCNNNFKSKISFFSPYLPKNIKLFPTLFILIDEFFINF